MANPPRGGDPPRLKKRFGQNHLVDGSLCRPLVEYLRPRGRRVLEIGPGGGVLTAELRAAGAEVWAAELDLEWAFHLRGRFPAGEVSLLAADATRLAWERLPRGTLVAGNLPFQVATRLIQGLLPHGERVGRAAFLVQKEVAERLLARPGEAAYGSLSVIVASMARLSWLGRVAPGSFRPPPKVSAAFVGLEPLAPPLPRREMPAFVALVRQSFARRRKTLRNSLAAAWGRERSDAVVAAAGFEPRTRAEALGLEDFVRLYRISSANASG